MLKPRILCLCLIVTIFANHALEIVSTDSLWHCANEKRFHRSQEYYEQGQLLVDARSMNDSLPFYRAATRLCPLSWQYWISLGAAEQEAGELSKAARRYETALSCPDADTAAIQLMINSLSSLDPSVSCTVPSEEVAAVDLPRYQLKDVTAAALANPFIVTDAMISVPDRAEDLLGYFHRVFGYSQVEFYPQNMRIKPGRLYHSNLSDALDYLDFPDGAYTSSDTSEIGAYIQWPLGRSLFQSLLSTFHLETMQSAAFPHNPSSLLGGLSDGTLDAFFNKTHWYMVLIGEERAGIFRHADQLPVGSWQAQLWGSKRWTICPPEAHLQQPKHSSDYPLSIASACKTVDLQPGQVIFYPPYFFHETRCLQGPCVSLSSTVISPHFAEDLHQFVREECVQRERGYHFDRSLCERVLP